MYQNLKVKSFTKSLSFYSLNSLSYFNLKNTHLLNLFGVDEIILLFFLFNYCSSTNAVKKLRKKVYI